ncbi:MAG: Gfo/Idh/MocA family oxidoreductase [Puniceicoccales bacterium]|jgi:predicted dehydrogenase|nr:Gfo/Idh/MocA family oxidoreductase [Puniceicoccales bacterium]
MDFSGSRSTRALLTRASFLKTTLAGGGLLILPSGFLRGAKAPSNRITVAGVGFGGMGAGNLGNVMRNGGQVVALADVDEQHVSGARRRLPKVPFYRDFRELLDATKDLDAVLTATPDHIHALVAAAAIKRGKHVFVQKPLAHDIWECRELARLAREKNIVSQMGIQGRVATGHWRIRQWIDAGAIGELTAIDAWCDLSYYPWGHASWSTNSGRKPAKGQAVPKTLDWNLWLGPAAFREYHRAYHPGTWRAWWDFGNGMMGDRGAHTLDVVFSILGERMPDVIDATSCGLNPDTHPLSAIITFRFTGKDGKRPFKVTWFEGTRPPRPVLLPDNQRLPGEGGIIFTGSKGVILAGVYADSPRLLPVERKKDFPEKRPEKGTLPSSIESDWLNAIRGGRKAAADFAYSARLTEFTMLGNLAKRADGKIVWDEQAMRVTNNDPLNSWVKRPRREGFEL